MKCCRQDLTRVELQVAGQPYVLRRCADCGTNYWMRNGEQVSLAEVTAALESETLAKAVAAASKA